MIPMTRKELWVFEKVELVNAHKILRLEVLIGSQLWWVLGSFPANCWVADFFFFYCRDCFHSWNFICFPTVFGKQMKVHFIWTVEHISVCQATTRKTKKIKRKEKKSSSWMIWLFNIWYYWFCLPLAPPPTLTDW